MSVTVFAICDPPPTDQRVVMLVLLGVALFVYVGLLVFVLWPPGPGRWYAAGVLVAAALLGAAIVAIPNGLDDSETDYFGRTVAATIAGGVLGVAADAATRSGRLVRFALAGLLGAPAFVLLVLGLLFFWIAQGNCLD